MPIKIPDSLPANRATRKKENIFVMTEHRALHQDIRPLRVLLLNLMPHQNHHRDANPAKALEHAAAG